MATLLPSIACLRISGEDAAGFLHAQLSQDILKLAEGAVTRAAWCDVKGRMLVSLTIWREAGAFFCLLSRDLVEAIIKRLKMFVLRSKVVIEALNTPLCGFFEAQNGFPNTAMTAANGTIKLFDMPFYVSVNSQLCDGVNKQDDANAWLFEHTKAGIAHISLATSGAFLPQMVNYELTGGVNFKKGCYPGQEVVVRSQYLGKLKRRGYLATIDLSEAAALTDIFTSEKSEPVGQVIQAAPISANETLVFFECTAADAAGNLSLAGQPLNLLALPYELRDITR